MDEERIETVENDGYPTEEEYAAVFGSDEDDQELQEPSGNGGEQGDGGGDEPPAQTPQEPQSAGQEMPAEERHRQAAMRRQREEQIRQQAEQARVDGVYRQFFEGQTNPFTGRPILTEADYRSYQQQLQQRERQQRLEQAGLDDGIIRDAVNQELGPIRQQLQAQQLQAARARARQVNDAAQAAIGQALANIARELPDANIKTVEDIAAMPTGPAFNSYVQRGYSLEEAFYLANRKELTERAVQAARTAARNGMANRQHLSPTNPSGGDSRLELTAEQIREFREWNPGASLEEIRKAYEAEL